MQESHSRRNKGARGLSGALVRLFRDNAGNTLAIVGAALIPITAMIGSGLDMSRAYMAKSRLQSACDAASLAARRVMKNDNLSSDVLETGNRFFDFNFPQGLYQTEEFEPAITRPDTGLVRIRAETRIPTTVMKLFGFGNLPLKVSCESSLNFVNTDVVLVLDVTGSMNDHVVGVRKMDALQDAVMALYDELAPVQTQLKSQGLRLRYGFVPYSGTVNVGRMVYAEDPSYIRNSTPYQSRVATYDQLTYLVSGNPTTVKTSQTYSSTLSSNECNRYGSNRSYPTRDGDGPFTVSGSEASGTKVTRTYEFQDRTNTGTCRRYQIDTTTNYVRRYSFKEWTYKQASLDTSEFKKPGGVITLATDSGGTVPASGTYDMQELASIGSGMSKTTEPWNGCIEERETTSSITASSGFSIPSNAYDLNINYIPDSEETRWSPFLPKAIYQRQAGTAPRSSGSALNSDPAWWACPYESRRLNEWERDNMQDYVDELQPIGGTYHDIGMIWGARLISTGGIFGDGCEEYNGMPCNRHVIFMTDGQQTAYCSDTYTAYGLEQNDIRVTGAGSCPDQLARHQQRFRMICNATKNMDVSVWVVAFDTALNADLRNCASNADQATASVDPDDLIADFREIGNRIGALRLTK